jgi:hypothetical protein
MTSMRYPRFKNEQVFSDIMRTAVFVVTPLFITSLVVCHLATRFPDNRTRTKHDTVWRKVARVSALE